MEKIRNIAASVEEAKKKVALERANLVSEINETLRASGKAIVFRPSEQAAKRLGETAAVAEEAPVVRFSREELGASEYGNVRSMRYDPEYGTVLLECVVVKADYSYETVKDVPVEQVEDPEELVAFMSVYAQ